MGLNDVVPGLECHYYLDVLQQHSLLFLYRQRVICRAIKSALEQSHKNLEVIYVDDASTDNSIETINENPNPPAMLGRLEEVVEGVLILKSPVI